MSRRISLFSVIVLISVAGASCAATTPPLVESQLATAAASNPAFIGDTPLEGNINIGLGMPRSTYARPEIIISRSAYVISWNVKQRSLNWVAWRVAREDLGRGRFGSFKEDPDLATHLATQNLPAVQDMDYRGSCYDRGHQVPSADRNTDTKVNQLTFFMSNVIPQTAFLNRVIWEHLETYTRNLIKSQTATELYEFAGPIFERKIPAIGPSQDIAVPSHNFKIVVQVGGAQQASTEQTSTQQASVQQSKKVIAVIMPNTLRSGKFPDEDLAGLCNEVSQSDISPKAGTKDDWTKYQTTVAEVESRTGLTFSDLKL